MISAKELKEKYPASPEKGFEWLEEIIIKAAEGGDTRLYISHSLPSRLVEHMKNLGYEVHTELEKDGVRTFIDW